MIDGRRGRNDVGEDQSPADEASLEEQETGAVTLEPDKPARRVRLGRALVRLGVTANQVTVFGVLLAGLTGAMIALGHLYLAVALITVGGLMDALDGAVAKAAGTSSRRGAFLDSVSDRVADGFIFGGAAWYLAEGSRPGLSLLPLGILAVGNVISYERAKAESLGWDAKGGLMERAERLIGLAAALTFNFVLVPLLWTLLGLCVVTAAQRFVKVWRQASAEIEEQPAAEEVPAAPSVPLAWRPPRVESRWRAWREARVLGERRRPTGSQRPRRRQGEPLSTRLRAVLASERVSGSDGNGLRRDRWARLAERRRAGTSAALRRRFTTGR
jgi:CDP-diacylglycerol--glycerol-3-phosphate 3-phosphatidyltransferase